MVLCRCRACLSSCQETLIFAFVLFVMCMGLCVKTEADNIPVDLGEMVVDSLGNDGDGDGDSRDSRNRIEDENDAESPKIRKKTWSFRAIKTNFSRGTRGDKMARIPVFMGD